VPFNIGSRIAQGRASGRVARPALDGRGREEHGVWVLLLLLLLPLPLLR